MNQSCVASDPKPTGSIGKNGSRYLNRESIRFAKAPYVSICGMTKWSRVSGNAQSNPDRSILFLYNASRRAPYVEARDYEIASYVTDHTCVADPKSSPLGRQERPDVIRCQSGRRPGDKANAVKAEGSSRPVAQDPKVPVGGLRYRVWIAWQNPVLNPPHAMAVLCQALARIQGLSVTSCSNQEPDEANHDEVSS